MQTCSRRSYSEHISMAPLCLQQTLLPAVFHSLQSCMGDWAWVFTWFAYCMCCHFSHKLPFPFSLTRCGKTTICQLFAALAGHRFFSVNCHLHMETSDFLGGLRPVRHTHQVLTSLQWCQIYRQMKVRSIRVFELAKTAFFWFLNYIVILVEKFKWLPIRPTVFINIKTNQFVSCSWYYC